MVPPIPAKGGMTARGMTHGMRISGVYIARVSVLGAGTITITTMTMTMINPGFPFALVGECRKVASTHP